MTLHQAKFSPDRLIDPTTGEYDQTYIQRHAELRARRNLDRPEGALPAHLVESHRLGLEQIAHGLRVRWRREHGLPDDTVYVMCAPYGRQRTGVRHSAF